MATSETTVEPADLVSVPINLRSYQYEMFERSLERNTIVVMETGSGKTPVYASFVAALDSLLTRLLSRAIHRIMHAVETCKNDQVRPFRPESIPPSPSDETQLIWFLTQGVALCRQQRESLQRACPAIRSTIIVGDDGPELWGSQATWTAVLANVDVVFSTFEILHQALAHAYVRMERLRLLIFDEAHHVTKDHPSNKIMRKYHETLHSQGSEARLPSILGLTASPAENGSLKKLLLVGLAPASFAEALTLSSDLEANLAATCRSPRQHRIEMREFVHRPKLERLVYCQPEDGVCTGGDVSARQFYRPPLKKHREAMQKLQKKVQYIAGELGWWAALSFVTDLVDALQSKVDRHALPGEVPSRDIKSSMLDCVRPLLCEVKRIHEAQAQKCETSAHVSTKFRCLANRLRGLLKDRGAGFHGILFVRQRITTVMLEKLLQTEFCTSDELRCGSFVGESNSCSYDTDLSELVVPRTQSTVLKRFREREKNLIVATDALDEGIDVAACNSIICFDPPHNLRSFIQKRGRAREKGSTYVIMVSRVATGSSPRNFEDAELLMAEMIASENEKIRRACEKESIEEKVGYQLTSPIGACLTADMTRAHLEHFCAKLPKAPYTDTRPTFHCLEDEDGLTRADVQLPMSVPAAARVARSLKGWETEKAAVIDAAFQAYKGLFDHGLLTEHLLPFDNGPKIEDDFQRKRVDFYHLGGRLCVWEKAPPDSRITECFRTTVTMRNSVTRWVGQQLALWTYTDLSPIKSFSLNAEEDQEIHVECQSPVRVRVHSDETKHALDLCTRTLLSTCRSRSVPDDETFAIFVTPDLALDELPRWVEKYKGQLSARSWLESVSYTSPGIIVNAALGNSLHLYRGLCQHQDEYGTDTVEVECAPFPRRRNFLKMKPSHHAILKHEIIEQEDREEQTVFFNVDDCFIRRLPLDYAWTMRYLPSIFHTLEMTLTGYRLMQQALPENHFQSLSEVVGSITSPSTGLQVNYERLEFLGDSLLKHYASQQLFCDYPNWHEGYLTRERNTIIANISLAEAAVDRGLDMFILGDAFVGKDWMIPTEVALSKQRNSVRHLPMKTVADVVESLIGAAFLGDGMRGAARCMSTLLPKVRDQKADFGIFVASSPVPNTALGTSNRLIDQAESLVDYHFQSKHLLLEALTHPSCRRDIVTEPYQRLEFLGDAVLDVLVVTKLFQLLPQASQSLMTKIKAALVNADLLAFLNYSFKQSTEGVSFAANRYDGIRRVEVHHELALWMLMRYEGEDVAKAREESTQNFQAMHRTITASFDERTYPWVELCQLRAPKFVSDTIESVLGAMFVDENGELNACQGFLERIGLMHYLRRLVSESIDVIHPQERLNRLLHGRRLDYSYRPSPADSTLWDLDLFAGDEVVAQVRECASKDEANTMAASRACCLLTQTMSGSK